MLPVKWEKHDRALFCLNEKQYKAQRKDWESSLIEAYVAWRMSLNRDVVPNSEINDCCGRKVGKRTERKNKSWFVQSGTRKERRS